MGRRVGDRAEAVDAFVAPIASNRETVSEAAGGTGSEGLTRALLRLVARAGTADEGTSTDVSVDKDKHPANAYASRP